MQIPPIIGPSIGKVNINASTTSSITSAIIPTMAAPAPVAPVIPPPVSVAAPIPSAPVVSLPPGPPELSVATTLSMLTQSVAVSSTTAITSPLQTTSENISSLSSPSYFAEETLALAPEQSYTPSAVPNSPWVVTGENTGTKIIIYGLLGFFFGFFMLLILIDICRRPQQAKESIKGIASSICNFPKSVGLSIYKRLASHKHPRSGPEAALNRNKNIDDAAVIDRLAARRPVSANPNEKAASSAEASSNTAVADEANQGSTSGAASVPASEQERKSVEETPEQSQAADGPSSPTIRRVSVSEPPEAHCRPSTSGGTVNIAELEANPIKRRPVSSNYSIAYEEKVGEGSKKPDFEPVLEKPETDLRSWAQWEADLMATVRSNPHA